MNFSTANILTSIYGIKLTFPIVNLSNLWSLSLFTSIKATKEPFLYTMLSLPSSSDSLSFNSASSTLLLLTGRGFLADFFAAGLATLPLAGPVFLAGDLVLDLEALEDACLAAAVYFCGFAVFVGVSFLPEADLSGLVLFAPFFARVVDLAGDLDFPAVFARDLYILGVIIFCNLYYYFRIFNNYQFNCLINYEC